MTKPSSEEEKQQDTSNHGNYEIITALGAAALALASRTSLATQYAVQPALSSIAAYFGVSAAVTVQDCRCCDGRVSYRTRTAGSVS